MRKKKRDLFGFSVFSIATLPVLILTVCLTFVLTRRLIHDAGTFSDYSAMGELLLVIVIGVGEFVAFLELRYVANDRAFHSWLEAQRVWTDKVFVQCHGSIFKRLDHLTALWTRSEIEEAKDTCRKLDEFAHLVPFLGERKALDVWGDPLGKAWLVLEEIVDREREETGWPHKWEAFSEIGRKALDKLIAANRDPRRTRPQLPRWSREAKG